MARAAEMTGLDFNGLMSKLEDFNNIPSYGILIQKLTKSINSVKHSQSNPDNCVGLSKEEAINAFIVKKDEQISFLPSMMEDCRQNPNDQYTYIHNLQIWI
jgi:hypothetical protein